MVCGLITCFCKENFIGTQPHALIYILFYGALFTFLFDSFFSVSFWTVFNAVLSCLLIFASEMFNLPLAPFIDLFHFTRNFFLFLEVRFGFFFLNSSMCLFN